jgi:hypothetical protein
MKPRRPKLPIGPPKKPPQPELTGSALLEYHRLLREATSGCPVGFHRHELPPDDEGSGGSGASSGLRSAPGSRRSVSMRAGDLIETLMRHTVDHQLAWLLFQYQQPDGYDLPHLVKHVENIEGILMTGWRPCAIIYCDIIARTENWGAELLANGDQEFMENVLQLIGQSRAQEFGVPLNTLWHGEADA